MKLIMQAVFEASLYASIMIVSVLEIRSLWAKRLGPRSLLVL